MEIKGSYHLPCDPQRAWEALNDADLLKACLKGCERLEKVADDKFEGTVQTKIGPVSARFNGSLTQTDVQAPNRCTMVFEGQGGVAGFAKGQADVTLDPAGGGTQLSYLADARIGGKLAQMGARLVEGTARTMAEDFFGKFAAALAAEQVADAEGSAEDSATALAENSEEGEARAAPAPAPMSAPASGQKLWVFAAIVIGLALILYGLS